MPKGRSRDTPGANWPVGSTSRQVMGESRLILLVFFPATRGVKILAGLFLIARPTALAPRLILRLRPIGGQRVPARLVQPRPLQMALRALVVPLRRLLRANHLRHLLAKNLKFLRLRRPRQELSRNHRLVLDQNFR